MIRNYNESNKVQYAYSFDRLHCSTEDKAVPSVGRWYYYSIKKDNFYQVSHRYNGRCAIASGSIDFYSTVLIFALYST